MEFEAMKSTIRSICDRLTSINQEERQSAVMQLGLLMEKLSTKNNETRSDLIELLPEDIYNIDLSAFEKNEIISVVCRAINASTTKTLRGSLIWILGKAWGLYSFKFLICYLNRFAYGLNEDESYQLLIAIEDQLICCRSKQDRRLFAKLIKHFHAINAIRRLIACQPNQMAEGGVRLIKKMSSLQDER